MTVKIVEIDGRRIAMLPAEDYERLVGMAEDRLDEAAAQQAERRRDAGEEYIPAGLVDRLLAGENPLRVWRQHRGVTLEELAVATGTHASTLSSIERGIRQGRPGLWRALADALRVSVDDILPAE